MVFQSTGDNLVPDDHNGADDVFVHDRQTGQTTRASVSSEGLEGNGTSFMAPGISSHGRYVVFNSNADNLVPGDNNGELDVFVHDRQRGLTIRVSETSDGIEGDSYSWYPSISGDGRHVVFTSGAELVPEDQGYIDVYVASRFSGQGMPWLMLLLPGGE